MSEAAVAAPSVAATYRDDEREEVGEGQPWFPKTMDEADWVLKRLGELTSEVQENESIGSNRVEEILARTRRLNATAGRGILFFRGLLENFVLGHRDELLKGKRKSRALPHGRIGFRTKPGRLTVVDADALLAWAIARPVEEGLVRIKEEPVLKAIQQAAMDRGIVPPGTAWVDEQEELTISTATTAREE